jgi:hypothetical protein
MRSLGVVLLIAGALLGGGLRGAAEDAKKDGEILKAERELTPFHLYTVKFEAGKTYTIDMIALSDRFDPFLRLEDDQGKRLAEDDDSGGGLNARIVFPCAESGTYHVVARALAGSPAGKYRLTVREAKSARVAAPKLELQDGSAEIESKLAPTDTRDRVRKASVCKLFSIQMSAGKTYQIDMISSAVDSFLRLENSAGKELARDDDGGGFPNARIVYECTGDGAYRIIATTFGGGT